ncbi:UBX domain protein [Aspergillus vadensis CBS 113365]|uniref:UBX domain-containing protein 2 n=1 Tax=Aspergillus vadensis (strain CBS 113365 / IMI 142717 / IBT 24658) TaxID=1448311 RepID=A0A319AYA7_ASPVC|nr:UBX domain protein [Aspergillus vadensis CBS 113365]PYH65307.1 UBX domain protein [Aspergillus vadensis CBS 113365]
MFYSGSLQEGIAAAVAESKAVVCFVRDDEQTSTEWEESYFTFDEELAQLLPSRAVLLRFTKGSQEAGFLASFCPIVKFPTVVVIKNGMMCDYLVPDISKEDFRDRLLVKLDESRAPVQQDVGSAGAAGGETTFAPVASDAPATVSPPAPEPVSSAPVPAPAPAAEPAPTPAPSQPAPQPSTTEPEQPRDAAIREGKRRVDDARAEQQRPSPTKKLQQQKQEPAPKPTPRPVTQESKPKPKPSSKEKPSSSVTPKEPATQPAERRPPSPPKQYRLQVRLFDGSSVRSSFTPTQTIRNDVRPWLDGQMEERSPYNLKHILTPLPNRTLTIADEEQTLAELGLGSSANLVMVPIQSYTEAYSGAGASLPVRAVSSAYGLVSSAVGTATGLVGSFFGYGTTQSSGSEAAPTASMASSGSNDAGRRRVNASRGPIIRTLRDAQNEGDDRQFYNGNQLNFQPRNDGDRR